MALANSNRPMAAPRGGSGADGPWYCLAHRTLADLGTVVQCRGAGICPHSTPEERNGYANAVNSHAALVAALRACVQWMDDSGLSRSKPGGKGVIHYDGFEYSVVTDARAALSAVMQGEES